MENDKSTRNKRIFKGILVAALALCSIYSWTLPISSNFCKMSWIMKALTGGSILCGLAFYVIVIALSVKNGKKNKKYYYDILYASPLLVLETLNVLAIFDYEIWGHKSTLAGLSLVIIMFVELFASIRTIFKKSFGQENTPVILLALAVISFVLAAVNEGAGNIEPANLCYKVCFGLAYLVAIALYTHQFIYKTKKSEKIISTIIGIVFWGAAITISFPYYVKWCGLSETAFETFVSIYAAVLGGGITLAGVAWTIKDANDKRLEDLKRIETEHKEEERVKNIPYIKLVSEIVFDDYIKIPAKSHHDFNKISDRKYFNENQSFSVQISSFGIKNISNTHILFDSVHVNNNCYPFSGIIIEKDKTCQINICDNAWITLTEPLNLIKLILHDMIGNNYCVECNFLNNPNFKPETGEEITDDGEKYFVIARSYVIQRVCFPKHLAEGEKQ